MAPMIPALCAGAGEPDLVSVIIPTYNRGYIIGPTLDSVLGQSYRNIELIIVDDGSTDDTTEVVKRYGPNVRYIRQPNAGLATARNTGLQAARGEYIAFQDSDDLWLNWKLEAQVELMKAMPQIVLSWSDMTPIDPQGKVLRATHLTTMYDAYQKLDINEHLAQTSTLAQVRPQASAQMGNLRFRYGDIASAMALGNLVHPPTAMLRRSCVQRMGGLDVTFSWTCEDYEFFWRVARCGPVALLEASTMLYRVGAADQLTQPRFSLDTARGNLLALQRHLGKDQPPVQLPPQQLNGHWSDSYLWLGREELFAPDGRRTQAIAALLRSVSYNPRQLEAWQLLGTAVTVPRFLFDALRAVKQRLGTAPQGG